MSKLIAVTFGVGGRTCDLHSAGPGWVLTLDGRYLGWHATPGAALDSVLLSPPEEAAVPEAQVPGAEVRVVAEEPVTPEPEAEVPVVAEELVRPEPEAGVAMAEATNEVHRPYQTHGNDWSPLDGDQLHWVARACCTRPLTAASAIGRTLSVQQYPSGRWAALVDGERVATRCETRFEAIRMAESAESAAAKLATQAERAEKRRAARAAKLLCTS